jgi:PAS domain S-box-containing protein
MPCKETSMQLSPARTDDGSKSDEVPIPLLILLVAGGYFLAATAGQALGHLAEPAVACWPANAVLLAGLLLAPVHCWWRVVLAALAAHLFAQFAGDDQFALALAWFGRNCAEALVGAAGVLLVLRARPCFALVRHVVVFLLACAVLAPLAASLLDLALAPVSAGHGEPSWLRWQAGFAADAAAIAVLVPLLAGWRGGSAAPLRRASLARHLEGALIAVLLLGFGGEVFVYGAAPPLAPLLLCAAVATLPWAAIRFGPFGASAALLLFACLAVAGTDRGRGPFAAEGLAGGVLALQLLAAALGALLLLLCAALAERGAVRRALREQERALGLALASVRIEVAALRDSEGRLRKMVDAMPQVLWSARADGDVDYANGHWQALAGEAADPAGDALWAPFICDADRARYSRRWRQAIATGKAFEAECRFCFPHQQARRWYLARAWPVRDEFGRVERWHGAWTDIEAQKQAQQAQGRWSEELEQRVALRTEELRHANAVLRAEAARGRQARAAGRVSEARFARVFRVSPVAMALSGGPDGVIWDVNDSWQELFGYKRADAIGKTAHDLRLLEDPAAALVPDPGQGAMPDGREARMRRRDGGALDIVLSGARIDPEPDGCFITILRDETVARRREREVRRQREQLTYLSRVVVLGELCGAIAHELNQPLATILANAQAGRRWLARLPEAPPVLPEILDDIVAADRRAAAVIRRLRALFVQGGTTMRPLDIAAVVRETLVLAASSLAEHQVAVAVAFDDDLGVVHGDDVQLEQVLLNLVVNACEALHAIPAGARRLDVACRAVPGAGVQLTVIDSGPGIPAGVLEQVFDSFFTTKPHGLGFGLSVSRAIIVAHGGRIEAANHAGGGAVFRITLPVTAGEPR